MADDYDCVIPAAGASSRMGSWKPLLPWAGATLIEATVGAARAAACRVILVLGERGGELRALFRGRPGIRFVDNPDWERGMLGSIQRALPLVRSPAFFSIPADMPLVGPEPYRLLVRAWEGRREGEGERAFFASFGGLPGHPVLIPSAWIPEILGLEPGGRLKDFLGERPRSLVETGSPAVHRDLDEPAEYEAALAELAASGGAGPADPAESGEGGAGAETLPR